MSEMGKLAAEIAKKRENKKREERITEALYTHYVFDVFKASNSLPLGRNVDKINIKVDPTGQLFCKVYFDDHTIATGLSTDGEKYQVLQEAILTINSCPATQKMLQDIFKLLSNDTDVLTYYSVEYGADPEAITKDEMLSISIKDFD